jgi:hypothetical protein
LRFGYVKVSAVDQNTVRQLDGVDVERVFTDKASGKDTTRPKLARTVNGLGSYRRHHQAVKIHDWCQSSRNHGRQSRQRGAETREHLAPKLTNEASPVTISIQRPATVDAATLMDLSGPGLRLTPGTYADRIKEILGRPTSPTVMLTETTDLSSGDEAKTSLRLALARAGRLSRIMTPATGELSIDRNRRRVGYAIDDLLRGLGVRAAPLPETTRLNQPAPAGSLRHPRRQARAPAQSAADRSALRPRRTARQGTYPELDVGAAARRPARTAIRHRAHRPDERRERGTFPASDRRRSHRRTPGHATADPRAELALNVEVHRQPAPDRRCPRPRHR